MNILYLTEFISAIGGGGELAFANFAREMGRKGHNVHVVCRKSIADDLYGRDWPNVTLTRINPEVNPQHGWFPTIREHVSFILGLIRQTNLIIRENNIEIIHANTLSPAVAGSILGQIHGVPVVTTFHHVQAVQSRKHRTDLLDVPRWSLNRRLRMLPRLVCEKGILCLPFEYVHAVSRATASDLKKFGYRGRIDVIPNGLHLTDYQTDAVSYFPYLLFVGRLVRHKNLQVVIEAFADITETVPDARLVVVGDGPMRKEWVTLTKKLGIHSKVHFTGYVSEERKQSLLSKCSALVFPSEIEGFGMAVLEAFAMTKPVIVSNIDALRELVLDEVDGFVIPSWRQEDWASKMRLVLSSPSLCREMGMHGKMKAEREFQMQKVGEKLEALYEKILSTRMLTVRNS